MARAETASASLRSDSIQGLAKSIAKPAYGRLLSAEPLLRRLVPVLIVAFLITICIGAVVQVLEQRRQIMRDARQTVEALADELTIALDHPARETGAPSTGRTSAALQHALPAWAMTQERLILVADADGAIVASVPNDLQKLGRPILDLLGPSQPLTTFGAAAGTLEITLPDGAAALATVRTLRNPLGAVAVIQTASDALTSWRSTTALTVTLSATTGFRRPDPRFRLPLAGDPGARSRSHLRHRALPHRHGAQPRPLRTMGLGFGARPRVLVALDV